MNKMTGRLALVLALANLAGCGLKGPLYFPSKEQPPQTTDSSTATQPDGKVNHLTATGAIGQSVQ